MSSSPSCCLTRMSSYSGLILMAVGSVCLFTTLTPVKVTKHWTPNMSPKLAGKSSLIGLYGSSCHQHVFYRLIPSVATVNYSFLSRSTSLCRRHAFQKHSEVTRRWYKSHSRGLTPKIKRERRHLLSLQNWRTAPLIVWSHCTGQSARACGIYSRVCTFLLTDTITCSLGEM